MNGDAHNAGEVSTANRKHAASLVAFSKNAAAAKANSLVNDGNISSGTTKRMEELESMVKEKVGSLEKEIRKLRKRMQDLEKAL